VHCGDTFLLYDEEDAEGKAHLHVIITEPDGSGQCVLVSVTTRRAKSDTMVCLDVGDHAFIKHPSVITYAYSKLLTVAQLEAMVAAGDATPKGQASSQLVARVQSGMMETDRAPREVQQFFKAAHRS
jgi:hypothetical protein